MLMLVSILHQPFPNLSSAHQDFLPLVLWSCAYLSPLCLLYNISPPHFVSSYISVSTHFHVFIATSSSAFPPACPSHLNIPTLISHLCLPSLFLVLLWSSQSSLFPLSIPMLSSLFFLQINTVPLVSIYTCIMLYEGIDNILGLTLFNLAMKSACLSPVTLILCDGYVIALMLIATTRRSWTRNWVSMSRLWCWMKILEMTMTSESKWWC